MDKSNNNGDIGDNNDYAGTTMTFMSVYVLIFLASPHFLCYHAIFFCVLRNALSSSVLVTLLHVSCIYRYRYM